MYFECRQYRLTQMPCSAASDLAPHCLQMSLLWYARYKWFKKIWKKKMSLFIAKHRSKN